MTCALFTQIKAFIIQSIDSSVSEISIAVAWFTHRELYQAILSALDRKVQVSIILIDDIINRGPNGIDFSSYLEKGGRIRFVDTRNLLMHNKFCLFDDKLLISGSYNWTYSAELRNEENIIATTEDSVCSAFRIQFNKLWEKLSPIDKFTRIEFSEVESDTLLKYIDELKDEYASMEHEHVLKRNITDELNNLKKNLSITELNTVITNSRRSKPILKASISLEILNNQIKLIINRGQELPHTHTVDAKTCNDYQKAVDCIIRYGNYSEADKNQFLVKLRIENLPMLKAGEVKFKVKVTIDTNGYMHTEFLCVNTGVSKSTIYNAVDIIDYQQV